MEYLQNLWNSPGKYTVILIAAIIIIYIPFIIIYMNKKKNAAAKFLAEHPTAARVYIKGAAQGALTVISVNNERPVTFIEGMKSGFFLLPGENVLELTYQWTRPGVLHKTVTTTVGPNKIKVTAETEKSYNIGYNKKEETYNFEEISK